MVVGDGGASNGPAYGSPVLAECKITADYGFVDSAAIYRADIFITCPVNSTNNLFHRIYRAARVTFNVLYSEGERGGESVCARAH